MGIHTGEPVLTDEGYLGLDVHRGARICSAAHGGQIIVSSITHDLLDGAVESRDLGADRSKPSSPTALRSWSPRPSPTQLSCCRRSPPRSA
jgi:class 3 adenylate cyclase